MAKKGKVSHEIVPALVAKVRQGEGVSVDASAMPIIAPGGLPAVALKFDLAKARVPDRRYAADACAIATAHGVIKIMFGQERIDGKGWRTLLVVNMPIPGVQAFLATLTNISNPTLEEVAANLHLADETLSAKASEPEFPNQVASLTANLGLFAVANTEACLDLYHASAFAVAAVSGSRKLSVDPVVRIDMRTQLFIALFSALRAACNAPDRN